MEREGEREKESVRVRSSVQKCFDEFFPIHLCIFVLPDILTERHINRQKDSQIDK